MLGRPDLGPAPLAGDLEDELPVFNWEDTYRRLLAQSPELDQARARVEEARCEHARQCVEWIPNVEVALWTKYDATVHDTLADVGVAFPLPVFDRNQGNIVKAEAELIAAQRELRRVELDLHNRLTVSFEEYATARWQVDAYRSTILPSAQKSLEMTRIGYREGEFGYLTLLTAQRTYFSVNLDYLSSLSGLWTRSVELEGMLLTGGLQPVE